MERWCRVGSCTPLLKNCGRNLGECEGVAKGVWSGVGEVEWWEYEGDGGAVDCGEPGLDFFV